MYENQTDCVYKIESHISAKKYVFPGEGERVCVRVGVANLATSSEPFLKLCSVD